MAYTGVSGVAGGSPGKVRSGREDEGIRARAWGEAIERKSSVCTATFFASAAIRVGEVPSMEMT